jgi:hypothetical protein
MRMPRVRFTVRGLMIAVAVVAILLPLEKLIWILGNLANENQGRRNDPSLAYGVLIVFNGVVVYLWLRGVGLRVTPDPPEPK